MAWTNWNADDLVALDFDHGAGPTGPAPQWPGDRDEMTVRREGPDVVIEIGSRRWKLSPDVAEHFARLLTECARR